MTFAGFGRETVSFLTDLRDNNTREWFTSNRTRYEAHFLEPAKSFVEAVGTRAEARGTIGTEPRVNGSIFWINRDTRFSKDKTPYKDHLDLWFWHGPRKQPVSAYFLRITPDQIGVGVGAHGFDKDRLARFRRAVIDRSDALEAAVVSVEGRGHQVRGTHYKRVPPGFDPATPFQERMIRHAGLYCGDDEPHPPSLASPEFVDWVVDRWVSERPIHDWLVDLG